MPALAAAAILTACGDPEPARISGQAYVSEGVTTEFSLTRLPVRLLPALTQVDSALRSICAGKKEILVSDTAARAEAWAKREEILTRYTIAETVTDQNATYALDSL